MKSATANVSQESALLQFFGLVFALDPMQERVRYDLVPHDANMSWTMFRNYGSHYNPFVTDLIIYSMEALVSAPKMSTLRGHAGVSQA